MRTDRGSPEEDTRQRLLEGWLPLAQEANSRYGWALSPPALEALIVAAAPSLRHARSALDACAILWATYTRTIVHDAPPL